ncbi:MAG: sigma-54-dependent Fis family transcriptional regulator [Proteobacteria bacterium]|nr:sigma-54-dependent Fis family transcriptional regulator [Pseudomonadota bacterium]
MPRILIVDDEKNIRRVLQALLEADGYEVESAADGDEARATLRRSTEGFDAILTDLRMPGSDGLQLLRWARASHPDTPVVMVTAHGTVDVAVEAMRAGAYDFITKPFDDAELRDIVGKAVAQAEANQTRVYEPGEDDVATTVELDHAEAVLSEIIGRSPAMQKMFALLKKVAPSPTTILVRGESGTGKELVARAIHRLSDRAGEPFVAVNCTAIPENLFESELFGHEKGAFTGATIRRPGRFELATSGTLFLDEIGELPLPMQAKLLRVLQERIIERVGGAHNPIAVDVRLIAATNADLEGMVSRGEFREDLFYRLDVVPIQLPPLRQRPSDIPALVDHFLGRFADRLGRDLLGVDPAVLGALVEYQWPGNIRQLENIVERMVLLAENGRLTVEDLPKEVRDGRKDPEAGVDTVREIEKVPDGNLKDIVREQSQRLEKELILRALEEDDWNVTHTAKRLGISRKGLQIKMKDYGLRHEERV